MISIPRFKDIDSIAKHLELSAALVRDAIVFLERTGVIIRTEDRWLPGEYHLHLDKGSQFIRQHHANWRMKAIHALDKVPNSDVRYSGVFSLSEEDADLLREKMLKHLNEYLQTVKASKEERAYVYCFDFFQV